MHVDALKLRKIAHFMGFHAGVFFLTSVSKNFCWS